MTTNDLIRELLEVLTYNEWNYGRFGEGEHCVHCFALKTEERHRENCDYVAAVQAAREYLATPALVENRTPMDAAAEAIQKAMPGVPVYPIDIAANVGRPTVTLHMKDGTQITRPAGESRRIHGELVRDWWKAVYDPAIPPVEKKENAT